jgi:hypothetical protein
VALLEFQQAAPGGRSQEGNSADVALERFGRPAAADAGAESSDADALSAATAMQRLMHDRGAGPSASGTGALGAGEPDLAALQRPRPRGAAGARSVIGAGSLTAVRVVKTPATCLCYPWCA